jgi:hypothetical protein
VKLHRTIRKRLHDSDGSVVGDVNVAVAASVGEPGGSHTHVSSHSRVVQRTQGERMTDETRKEDLEALTPEELEAQGAEQLPDREAMSLISANVAAPVNAAAALNVLSDNSDATATATQSASIDQSN